jgi:hypothetical protein
MNLSKFLGAALFAGLCLTAAVSDVHAQKGKKAPAAQPVAADPPFTKKAVVFDSAGLSWGMSPKQVADVVDKVLDDDYRPLYKDVSPGVNMKALDAQLAEDKAEFRRSRIDFGKLPTGMDSTPLKPEYTYLNGESLMKLTRKGENRYYFFIQEKLWKLIDDHKLSDASPYGKTYQEAVTKLATGYGVAGRVTAADPTHPATEVDWKDANTHVRAIQRSDTWLALGFEDNSTVSNLSTLRANKPAADDGIDPDVAAAMHKPDEPGPPPGKTTKPKK